MRPLLTVSLCLLLFTTACNALSWDNGSKPEFCSDPVSAVQDFGQITLPASYEALEVQCSVFFDHHTLHARFEMSSDDLETFQQNTLIGEWMIYGASLPDFTYGFGDYLDDEAIANLTSYTYGTYEPLVPVAQEILIDTSDSQGFVVYFTAFTSY